MDLKERLESALENVAGYFNFKSWTYTLRPMNETIKNYFGVLIPVTINGEKNKSVYVKIPPLEQPEALKAVTRQHYEVEVYTYCILLPIYKSITNMDTRKFMPDCYYASLEKNNEILVLQDMTCDGYKVYTGDNMGLDYEHVIISLKALAKFHCLSVIFKEKGFDFDTDIMKPYTNYHPEIYYTYIKNTIDESKNIFSDSKYYKYIKTLSENLATYVKTSTSEASFLVYGHGDMWRENILFKYDNKNPVEACILDFQKSRIMSPAQDILMFILFNIDPELGRKYNQHFLDVYLDELHRNLKENGVNNIISMENLVRDMKVVAPYCIAISIMSYSLWLGLGDQEITKNKNCTGDRRKTVLCFKSKVTEMLNNLLLFGYITL